MSIHKDRKLTIRKLITQATASRGLKVNNLEELNYVTGLVNAANQKTAPPVAPQSASVFLHKAAAIMEDRGKQYDQPEGERSMGKCIAAFNIITGKGLKESEGWLLLQVLKDVRQWQNPNQYHQDSADDCVAYSALKGEALEIESGVY